MGVYSYLLEQIKENKIYHLSKINMNNKTLNPRIPNNYFTKNGYEENKTGRICFSMSINGALMGLSYKAKNEEFYVHIPIKQYDIYRPSIKEVPDCKITKEVWIKENVQLKCIGKIRVIGDKEKDGISFKYGNKTAELYEWTWKWIEHY